MQCSEFDALLSQAIDGTLAGERLEGFEAHARECKTCGPLLQEAEAGLGWLKSLEDAEPPAELVTNILLRTSGVLPARESGQLSFADRLRRFAETLFSPIVGVARQPRFAMSFGMAFFTLSISLSLAGVKIGDLRHISLRPSSIRHSYYETSGRIVKYYENIRFVYEIESRVRQFKQSTTPAEQPQENNNNNRNRKENKDNTSGQPDQKQERNYSQEGAVPVYASLTDGPPCADLLRVRAIDPPVVHGATYRRFV